MKGSSLSLFLSTSFPMPVLYYKSMSNKFIKSLEILGDLQLSRSPPGISCLRGTYFFSVSFYYYYLEGSFSKGSDHSFLANFQIKWYLTDPLTSLTFSKVKRQDRQGAGVCLNLRNAVSDVCFAHKRD